MVKKNGVHNDRAAGLTDVRLPIGLSAGPGPITLPIYLREIAEAMVGSKMGASMSWTKLAR
jgi:hypothetical protein